MKVAVVTNTGEIITRHFGRAKYYRVFTVENGSILSDELREKYVPEGHHHHHHHGHGAHEHHAHGMHEHGSDHADRHQRMLEPIQDCDVVIVGGMGWGMYEALRSRGKQVILTDEKYVEEAIRKFLDGTLKDFAESRLH